MEGPHGLENDWQLRAVGGLFVSMVTMFNQVNGRIDSLQAEMNRRFDQIFEGLRVFEGRITRLEEKAGIGPKNTE